MTSLGSAMLPAALAAVLGFVLIVTLDPSVPPIIAVIDLFAIWWILMFFLVTLKDDVFRKEAS